MAALPDPPSVHLITAGPEHTTVADGFVAAFHHYEGVDLKAAAGRTSVESLFGEMVCVHQISK